MPYNGFVKFTFRAVQKADTETLNKFVISSSTNEIDIDSFANIPNQVSSSFIAPWGLNALTSHLIPKGHYVRIYTRISTYTEDHQITIYPTKLI